MRFRISGGYPSRRRKISRRINSRFGGTGTTSPLSASAEAASDLTGLEAVGAPSDPGGESPWACIGLGPMRGSRVPKASPDSARQSPGWLRPSIGPVWCTEGSAGTSGIFRGGTNPVGPSARLHRVFFRAPRLVCPDVLGTGSLMTVLDPVDRPAVLGT